MSAWMQLRRLIEKGIGHRCPCCGVVMTRGMLPESRNKPTNRSKGHIWSAASTYDDRAAWVYICRRCNEDQGKLSMFEWLAKLRRDGDIRALTVAELVIMINNAGLNHENKPRRLQ